MGIRAAWGRPRCQADSDSGDVVFGEQAAPIPHSYGDPSQPPTLSPKPDPDCRDPSVLPTDSSPTFRNPQTPGALPPGLTPGLTPTAPPLSHTEMCTPRTSGTHPEHTALHTHRCPPTSQHPKSFEHQQTRPAAGWGPGEQRPTWGQGQKALSRFDAEYSSALGVGGAARPPGGGGAKTHPDPKLFSSKSMYFSIILLGI